MIVLNEDGEIEQVDDPVEYFKVRPVSEIDTSRQDYTNDEIRAWKESYSDYKKRVARNGICPHDKKQCSRASICVLEQVDACINFNSQGNTCSTCDNAPMDGDYTNCPMFDCMIMLTKR